MSSTTGQPRNPRYIRGTWYHSREKLRWPENRAPKRMQAAQQQCDYIRMYTSEADLHKPGIYGVSVRVWANACHVFRRTPSRGGRGRRAALDLFRVFF